MDKRFCSYKNTSHAGFEPALRTSFYCNYLFRRPEFCPILRFFRIRVLGAMVQPVTGEEGSQGEKDREAER